jgi:hypothetical protein
MIPAGVSGPIAISPDARRYYYSFVLRYLKKPNGTAVGRGQLGSDRHLTPSGSGGDVCAAGRFAAATMVARAKKLKVDAFMVHLREQPRAENGDRHRN